MDLSKISKGGQIFSAAGIVYFIASLLPWYTFDVGPELRSIGIEDVSANAWGDLGFLWGALWAILFLAATLALVLPAFGVSVPKFPAAGYLAVAALATLFTVLKLLIGEDDPIETSFGIILAVVAALGALFGAFTMFKDAGGSLSDLKDMNKMKSQFGGGGTPPPGMPPPPPPR
ncbi:MAG: hypothetical protein HY826_08095 [Actinobacteria bacterium]|nr:hypothetical protein [Actinomycetota bacterium]